MTPEESEEAVRLLRYLAQKVRRYGDASVAGKGVIYAKFMMLGAMQEAEDFVQTLKTEPWLWRSLKRLFRSTAEKD